MRDVPQTQDLTGTGGLLFEATQTLGDGTGPSLWMLLLVAGLFLLALWSALSRTKPPTGESPRPPSLRNLFLGIRFRSASPLASALGDSIGHLMALDLRSATLVTPSPLGKGERLCLQLDSLPGYPGGAAEVEAEVVAHRVLDGEPPSHLVKVRFAGPGTAVKASLLGYLKDLARDHRLAPSH